MNVPCRISMLEAIGGTAMVTCVLQWCYSGVTGVSQDCYSGNTEVLQECHRRIIIGPLCPRGVSEQMAIETLDSLHINQQ
jgi:hypothetical protein